jgi:hypothetical protein
MPTAGLVVAARPWPATMRAPASDGVARTSVAESSVDDRPNSARLPSIVAALRCEVTAHLHRRGCNCGRGHRSLLPGLDATRLEYELAEGRSIGRWYWRYLGMISLAVQPLVRVATIARCGSSISELRALRDCYAALSRREREVMAPVVSGLGSLADLVEMGARLGIGVMAEMPSV